MFIDVNSIIINNVPMGQYLLNAQYQYNKLWGEDSGRSLDGSQSGTFLGVYPKFVLTFRRLRKDELEYIFPIIDNPYQSFRYYDPHKKEYITIDTYTGDFQFDNNGIIGHNGRKNGSFDVSFIAVSRRE